MSTIEKEREGMRRSRSTKRILLLIIAAVIASIALSTRFASARPRIEHLLALTMCEQEDSALRHASGNGTGADCREVVRVVFGQIISTFCRGPDAEHCFAILRRKERLGVWRYYVGLR
jgi:hypothetical protein